MSSRQPIKVAILWHMHQPNYREPNTKRLAMPWVRLHALKDYLDMPLRSASFENIKVTFNLVPSLLDQLELYLDGGTDRHLELSRLDALSLDSAQRLEILDTFFSCNPTHMITPYPRFRELYAKARGAKGFTERLAALFSSSEFRDLQVWSNLTWVDPLFRDREPVKTLFAKGRHYTEDEKQAFLAWQLELIGEVVPTYRRLLEEGRIDISFTPYYHPILPLLCDTDVAKEALPSVRLPRKRFAHPEDARRQIAMSADRFRSLFGQPLTGMWPSEGSVSEEVLSMMIDEGITWTATDQEILFHSLAKSGMDRASNPLHTVYEYGPGLRVFFRDQPLSDRIGFVYSGWPAGRAVADFVSQIKSIRELLADDLDRTVVAVILDGENAWEYFPDDATDFLDQLYRRLGEDPEIETITMSAAAELIEPRSLTSVYAGSWINHNFRIWIGHEEDNTAWDLLSKTRETVVLFERQHQGLDSQKATRVWDRIYMAEGSDWCWWYGDEHHAPHSGEFDRIFRRHLAAVYEELGLEIPGELLKPIRGSGIFPYTQLPCDVVTAKIDGRITHFYEWAGAGRFDCIKAGTTMHRGDGHISTIHFAYDRDRFYIRLDFRNRKAIDLVAGLKFVVELATPATSVLELAACERGFAGEAAGSYSFALDEILEVAIERRFIWPEGFGPLGVNVSLYDGDSRLETWPEQEPIELMVPEKHREMFWPS